ncbi:MAG: RCC1 domain-containing protein [Limisphaerales bacterium]
MIIVDTREQTPLVFKHLPARPGPLTTGDYSFAGAEELFSIERKSISNGLGAGNLIYSLAASGQQHLFSTQTDAIQRQALVDDCVARAQGNAAFAAAMDSLLVPETGVALADTPAEIIGNTNSPLYDDVTMSNLLYLSATSGDGSVTVSSNLLSNLFTNEMQTFWGAINTNLAVLSQINQSQPDILSQLTNQAANAQLVAAVQQGQPARLACATAAVLVQSKLLAVTAPQSSEADQIIEAASAGIEIGAGIDSLCMKDPQGANSLMSGILDTFNMCSGTESEADQTQDEIVTEIQNTQTLIGDLSANVNYGFDRVDDSLTNIFDTMNAQFTEIKYTQIGQNHVIAQLKESVADLRGGLVGVQTSLDYLEQELIAGFQTTERDTYLISPASDALFYQLRYEGSTLNLSGYESYENTFRDFVTTYAPDNNLSPDDDSSSLQGQLAKFPLDANLNYIKQYLLNALGQTTGGPNPPNYLPNPTDWFAGAYALMQLDVENPMLFRKISVGDINTVSANGQNLANFLGSLTFSGTNINWGLYNALETNYLGSLVAFNNQLTTVEEGYAASTNFALDTWQGWDANAPRVTATNSALLVATPRNLIAAGFYFSLALQANGTVVGWGDNTYGQLTIPSAATNLVSIAAGAYYCLALRADGHVLAWGNNTYSQTNVPASATNVIAIAAGAYHCLALRADGSVVAWGAGTNIGSTPNFGQSIVPAIATNITAITAGSYHSLALRADGTLLSWGNDNNQTDIPSDATNVIAIASGQDFNLVLKANGTLETWGGSDSYNDWNYPEGATNIVAIWANGWDGFAIRNDGTVFSWGRNDVSQLALPPSITNPQQFAPGWLHTLALLPDGTILACGDNSSGESTVPVCLATPPDRNHIAAGPDFSLALKADGTVVGWGYNYQGQATGVPNTVSPYISSGPVTYGGLTLSNVVAIAAGSYSSEFSLALQANGTVVGWGDNGSDQITIPESASNVVAIAAGGTSFSLALRADGTVVGWGYNHQDQITIPESASNVVAIAAGGAFSLALKADGTVVGWGDNNQGQATGVPNTVSPYISSGPVTYGGQTLSNVVAIAAGVDFSLALRADGTVVGWGDNTHGEINVPASATNVVAIAAGGTSFSLALRADGTVVGWGYNGYGQATGLPNTVSPYNSSGPVTYGGQTLSNVVAIAAGSEHSAALKADGSVVAWGDNGAGETSVPASAVDLSAWGEHPPGLWSVPTVSSPITAVASGSAHCLALSANGSVAAWGLNTWGQTDVPPQTQSGVQAVAAGFGHSLALTTSGSVLAWGLNDCEQTNVPAAAQSGVVAISAGGKHNLALTTGGQVVAWGLNDDGQTNVPEYVPGYLELVQGNVVAISAGGEHSLALTANGLVAAWGDNDDNQTSVPPQAQGGVVAIAAGRYHSLALTYAGQVVAWGLNSSGQCNVPAAAQSGVVAIAAGNTHSAALKADGSVVVWGYGPAAFIGQPAGNVVAMAAGDQDTLLLQTSTASGTNSVQSLSFVGAQIPSRVVSLFQTCNQETITELGLGGSDLDNAAESLSGTEALLADVLELGMPYTMERDGILHGFLYGSESLLDIGTATSFLNTQNAQLQANAPPQSLGYVALLRYEGFTNQLTADLNALQATGQPEIPRLVGHTMRLLNVLADAWTWPTNAPPPALELSRATNSLSLILYGMPYAQYTLQYCDSLSAPGWTTTSLTNLESDQTNTPPVSGSPQRFYRTLLPMP